ncbi:MAG: hypothetical protein OXP69_08350 [Spirochaetaceae bacterium]|nr:hypothetical protein [Spirochaetaceae bacterium]
MAAKQYTDDELASLQEMPKLVSNPRARWTEKPKSIPTHRQRTFIAHGSEDSSVRFQVYQRQNMSDPSDFSCGISIHPPSAPPLTLARYNGPSHMHGSIAYRPHIHRATARAIEEGKKPESEAEESDRFSDLDGALACLIEDFNLSGVEVSRNKQLEMFE